MDEMTAFDRQLAEGLDRMAGPGRHIDAVSMVRSVATQSPKWRFRSMFSATKFVVAGAIVALFGGFLLAGVLTQPSEEQVPVFGASPSASAQAEPTADAAITPEAEPEPTSDMPALTTMPGTFGPGGTLSAAREYHTATRLQDGRVLVVGGWNDDGDSVAPAELWVPDKQTFVPSDAPVEERSFHTATLLSDGRVLVVGGTGNTIASNAHDSAELWDPATGRFGPTGSLATKRLSHTATLPADGRVLVVGGWYDDGPGPVVVPEAEAWDPSTESFSPAGGLTRARSGHTATLLPDGRVLIAGGGVPGEAFTTMEVWDPATETFSSAGSLSVARAEHTATALLDGRVLVVGGGDWERNHASAEIWDPETASTTPAGSLAEARFRHDSALLADGHVLVIGGTIGGGVRAGQPIANAEAWNPVTSSFEPAGTLAHGRRAHATATSLDDGRVLVIGGGGANARTEAEIWSPNPLAAQTTAATPDFLPGVVLVTEEVEPGVYRVIGDGVRDISDRVGQVAINSEGDVWVGLGAGGPINIIRLGEPGVSLKLVGRQRGTLGMTARGAPVIVSPDPARLFDGEAWRTTELSEYDACWVAWSADEQRSAAGADGACYTSHGDGDGPLVRIDADGTRTAFTHAELGLGPEQNGVLSPVVGPDGSIWAAVFDTDFSTGIFEGLVRYDGSAWSFIPYDGDDAMLCGSCFSNLAVDRGGVIWFGRRVDDAAPVLSWDGDSWGSYMQGEGRSLRPYPVLSWPNGDIWFGSDARWDGATLSLAEPPIPWGDGWSRATAPDGSAWAAIDGQLYVVTPGAVMVTE